MAPVPVIIDLPAREEPEPEEITVTDMEDYSAEHKCSCAASDDNPY